MSDEAMTVASITPEPELDDGTITPVEEVKEDTAVDPDVPVDVLHVLEPLHEPVDVALTYDGITKEYVQKPLSFFSKMEFMRLVGTTLDEAMKGEDGLNVNTLLGDNMEVSSLNAGDFADLDSFLNMVAKVARYAPDFLKECYLVWLDVPKKERNWAREALNQIDDETGFEIIERFIDQNWEALESFFVDKIGRLFKRVADQRKKG